MNVEALKLTQQGKLWGSRWVGKTRLFSISAPNFTRLRKAFETWYEFIDVFEGAPWLSTSHSELRINTDASSRAWGGVWKAAKGDTVLSVGQEFEPSELHLDTETKEAMAVVRTLLGIIEAHGAKTIAGARLNLYIDNLSLVFAMANGASKNVTTHAQLEILFWLKLEHNFTCNAIWWDTKANWEADAITRTERDNDWRLDRAVFLELWQNFGPFQADLMASAVNVQQDPEGEKLPFYSRYFSAGCAGVDILAQQLAPGTYFCFPHQKMVRSVVAHLSQFKRTRIILVVRKGEKNWLPRVRNSLQHQQELRAGAVTQANLSTAQGVFVAYLLDFGL